MAEKKSSILIRMSIPFSLLKVYDPFSNGNVLMHEKIVVGKRRFAEKPYHATAQIENFTDLNHDGFPEIIINVQAMYDRYPRGIFVYDFHNQRLLWKYLIGPFLDHVQVKDLNSDGHQEIFFNMRAPSNGAQMNNTDDNHTYFMALDENGELIYQETTGGENTKTKVLSANFNIKQPEALITLTSSSNYETYEDSRLIKWRWNGNLHFSHEIESQNLRFLGEIYLLPYQGNYYI